MIYNIGKEVNEVVCWDEIDFAVYKELGIFEVDGILENINIKVKVSIVVVKDNEVEKGDKIFFVDLIVVVDL